MQRISYSTKKLAYTMLSDLLGVAWMEMEGIYDHALLFKSESY